MAIAEKLQNIINEKQAQITMTNYGLPSGSKITASTKFIDYPKYIFNAFLEALRTPDTLFTNLPKKSGTGANITLNDTANAPMRIELGATELTQDATPTPSSPQAVHTISGSNKVVVCGKNLADISNMQLGKVIIGGGIGQNYSLDNNTKRSSIIVKVKPSTQITLSVASGYYLRRACEFNKSDLTNCLADYPYYSSGFTTTSTITTKANTNYIAITIQPNPEADMTQQMIDNCEFMVEYNSSKTTYGPFVSQEANIDLSSRNIFNPTPIYFSYTRIQPLNTGLRIIDTASSSGNHYVNFALGDMRGNEGKVLRIKCTPKASGSNGIDVLLRNSTGYTTVGDAVQHSLTGTITYTIPNDISAKPYYGISLYSNYGGTWSSGCYIDYTDLIITIDNENLDYVPYYEPIEYSKIGNYEDKIFRTSGKNLFDENWELGIINVSTGANQSSSTQIRSTNYIKVKPSTTYYFKIQDMNTWGAIETYNSSKTFIQNLGSVSSGNTFTTPANCEYIRFYLSDTYGATYKNNVIISTENIDYEPYGSNEWYIKKNIGKVVLDGSETWTGSGSVFQALEEATPNKGDVSLNSYSNYYVHHYYASAITTNIQNGEFGWNSQKRLTIRNDSITGYANFQTWLGSNNTNVYYVLATPTYTKITGTLANQLENVYQKMLSQKGTTNISQVNNDLSFNLSVQAIEE